jgi:hypothetical protein
MILRNQVLAGCKMGKTVPSYRIALENEIYSWNNFAKTLSSEDVEAFEELMDACRNYASAGSNATRPVVFEAMAMSIMLFQQKKLNRLEKELVTLKAS